MIYKRKLKYICSGNGTFALRYGLASPGKFSPKFSCGKTVFSDEKDCNDNYKSSFGPECEQQLQSGVLFLGLESNGSPRWTGDSVAWSNRE